LAPLHRQFATAETACLTLLGAVRDGSNQLRTTSEADAESAEQGHENSHNGRENALLPFESCDGVEQPLAVLVGRFDGDNRA
jgi:hypothetical protein